MPIELLVLALLSAFWPTLIVIDVLAFQTARPVRILLAFLVGGLLTTVTVGTLLVVVFEGADLGSKSGNASSDAVLDFILAAVAFLLAVVLQRRPERPKKPPSAEPKTRSDFTARVVERGAPLAFAGAIVLNLFPGVFPLVALKEITEQHYSTAGVVATLLAFYVVMFVFIEVPIVAFLFARDWTSSAVARFNDWLRTNQKRVAVWALVAGGCYLTARGIYAVFT